MNINNDKLLKHTPSWILKKNRKNEYNLGMRILPVDKKICMYLIFNINRFTNDFKFSIKDLIIAFGCDHHTVYKAIKELKQDKYINIKDNHISFNGYHSLYKQKGGDNND